MKLKTNCIINTGLYQHLEFQIEIDIPDGLKNQELVKYLWTEYHGLLTPAKLEKFDEFAPPKIVEEPAWERYKKPYDKLNFAGKKNLDIAENAKADAELSTESELPEVEGEPIFGLPDDDRSGIS